MSKTKGNIIPFEENHFTIEEAFWSTNSYKNLIKPLNLRELTLKETKNIPKKIIVDQFFFINRNSEFHRINNRIVKKKLSPMTLSLKGISLSVEKEIDESLSYNDSQMKVLKEKFSYLSRKNKIIEIQLPLFYFKYNLMSRKKLADSLKEYFRGVSIKRCITNKPYFLLEK